MKWFATLALSALGLAAAVNPQLKQVNTVYILAMGNGIDQYLANRLAAAGVFQVVTDPQKADAILTDRVGESFENKLNELYPPPPTPEQLKKKEEEAKDNKKGSVDMSGGPPKAATSSFSRAKGNFFLVDRKTRAVLWSVYEPPKDTRPAALTRTAAKVVKRLETDLGENKPAAQ